MNHQLIRFGDSLRDWEHSHDIADEFGGGIIERKTLAADIVIMRHVINEVAVKYWFDSDSIMQFLEDNYLPDLQENIVAEHYIDPAHFEGTLNSYLGSAFSVQPVLTQSAWFRPHNRSEDIENLYFAGAGTHPGAGLPGVLASGKIAADLLDAGQHQTLESLLDPQNA